MNPAQATAQTLPEVISALELNIADIENTLGMSGNLKAEALPASSILDTQVHRVIELVKKTAQINEVLRFALGSQNKNIPTINR